MRYIHFLFCIFIISNHAISQENTANIWYFSDHAGVSFNTGIPIALTDGQTDVLEGSATLCDTEGNLLFYTDGIHVWNKNHEVMPNGSGLLGNPSATQSAIITPYPQNDSLYIVFTVDARENALQNGLRYSIINLNLDSGLGDITSEKNILLHAPVSERITSIIKNNQTDYWLIVHEWGTNNYLSYSITNEGVNTEAVVSSVGCVNSGGIFSQQHSIGYIKPNITGTKIAVANFRDNGFFELFDFDKVTGTLSNPISSDNNFYRPYGVEFSPSGDILYGSIMGGEYNNGKIYQFDLTQDAPLDNPELIASSSSHLCALQLAPNGKIYTAIKYYEYLGVIDQPEELGENCTFIHDAVYLEGKTSGLGLPSLFYYKGFQFFTGSEQDLSICEGDSVFLQNDWQTTAGTYYDTTETNLGWDSIVNTHLSILPTPTTPYITENEGVLISSSIEGNQWYYNGNEIQGAISQTYHPTQSGTYKVSTNNGNCWSFSDDYPFIASAVHEIENSFEVYPNPTKGMVNIKTETANLQDVKLINGLGHNVTAYVLLRALSNSEFSMDLSTLPTGVYFLSISEQKTRIIKL